MPARIRDNKPFVAGANGTGIVTFVPPPSRKMSLAVIPNAPNDPQAVFTVFTGGKFAGSAVEGQSFGPVSCEAGENLEIVVSNVAAGATGIIYVRGASYEKSEALPDEALISGTLPRDAADFQFQETTGTTAIIAAPASTAFLIRILAYHVGVTYNADTAGSRNAIIRLLNTNAGTVVIECWRVFLHDQAANPSPLSGSSGSPWIDLGGGLDAAAGDGVSLNITSALSSGRAFAQVKYQVVPVT